MHPIPPGKSSPSRMRPISGNSDSLRRVFRSLFLVLVGFGLACEAAVAQPGINVDPEFLEATLQPDQSESQSLTIANLGDDALTWEITEDGTAGAQSRRSSGLPAARRTSPSILDGIAAPAGLACGSSEAGACCEANGTPFCDDDECCSTVCDVDAFCCNTEWDSICADEAQDLCTACQAGPDCTLPPWMSANPAAGSVPGGDSQLVDVSFDTTGLAIGAYEANLCIASNDPVNSLVVVPVAMSVVGPPEIDVDPEQLEPVLAPDDDTVETLTIANLGGAALAWEITEDGTAGAQSRRSSGLPDARRTSPSILDGIAAPAGLACGSSEAGACCEANGTPFCDDDECCSTVCDVDAFCCNTEWDSICADEAQDLCTACQAGPDCTLPQWMSANPAAGSVPGDDSQLVDVSFDTTGLAIGAYEANLCIASNDPVNNLVVVPVAMSVVGPPEIDVDPEQLEAVLAPDDDTVETLTIANLGGAALAWEITEDGTTGAQSRRSSGLPAARRTSPSILDGIAAPAGLACGSSGAGACCEANGTPFCDDDECCSTVCDVDAYCCNTEWDSICADEAQDLCAVCGATPPVSCELPEWLSADPVAGSVPGGNSQLVDVSFDTTGLATGAYEANLCIASNDPVNSLVVVPVTMSVSEAVPALAVDPDSLNFGTVPIGGSAGPHTVTLTSSGTIAVEVTAIDAAAAPFERTGGDCPATPFELGPAASCTLAYTFSPTAEGSFNQSLGITSNADPAGFTLTGDAIELGPEPFIDVNPATLEATLHQDQSETQILDIANLGAETLTWEVADTWLAQASGVSEEFFDVAFADELVGMAVGANGTILRTEDGGETWTQQDAGDANHFFGIFLHDTATATIVGNNGRILHTDDGGTSWTPQTSGTSHRLQGVYFTDPDTGWAVGGSQQGRILHTADGGQTWVQQFAHVRLIHGVHFVDDQTGWAVGGLSADGRIWHTQNGGQTWSEQTAAGASNLNDVQFLTAQLGIAVGDSGILRTEDGGVNWGTAHDQPKVWGVSFADANTGLAVSRTGGRILRTHDAGATWLQEDKADAGFTTALNGVWLHTPGGAAWAVGGNGVILRRTAGGWLDHCQPPPWLGVEPISGTVEGGASQPVTVTFDTTGLGVGDHQATLCLASNDPLNPLVEVPIELTVLPTAKLVFNPTGLDFGQVIVGDTGAPQSATLANTGTAEATELDFTAPGGDFSADTSACGDTLAIGASCPVSVTFAPTANGPANAELHVDSTQGVSVTLGLTGTGVTSTVPELTFIPASLDFGDVDVGSGSPVQTALLQNTGEVAVTGLAFIAPGGGFLADWTACGDGLDAGESCGISVHFSPSVTGPANGTLEVLSTQGANVGLGLQGNGVEPLAPELVFTPSGLDFGDVQVGTTTESETVMLENTGTAAATGLFFTTPEGGFEVDASACGETLAAGASCPASVSFTPAAAGSWDATLVVTSAEGVSATLGAQPPPERYLYFRSTSTNGIFRMDPADPGSARSQVSLFEEFNSTAARLAVDPQNCAYYLANSTGPGIIRIPMDGSEQSVVWPGENVLDVELDAGSQTLYFSTGSHRVYRGQIGPAGISDLELLVDASAAVGTIMSNLTLDVDDNRLYFIGNSGIWRVNLDDGSDKQLLWQGDPDDQFDWLLGGLAVDPVGGKMYWAIGRLDPGSPPAPIHRANLDGSNHEIFLTETHATRGIHDIAVDPVQGKIFWGGSPGGSNADGLYQADLDGSNVERNPQIDRSPIGGFVFVPGDIDAHCGPPAADFCPPGADCNRVDELLWGYGVSSGGSIWRAKADGTRRELVLEHPSGLVDLAVANELGKVFWTTSQVVSCSTSATGSCVQAWRADLDGANIEVVLQMPFTPSSGEYPSGIAVDVAGGKVYVGQRRRNGFDGGNDRSKTTLWRGSLDGSDLETEVRFVLDVSVPPPLSPPGGENFMRGPALDTQARLGYVGAEDAIYRFDLDTDAPPEVLVPSLPGDLWPEPGPSLWEIWGSAHALQLDPLGGKLYWRQGFRSGNSFPSRTYRSDLNGTNIEKMPWMDVLNRHARAIDPHGRRMYGGFNLDYGHVSRWEFESDHSIPVVHSIPGAHETGPIALLPATAVAELSLVGTGVGPAVSLAPEALEFGEQAVGASSPPQIALLENIGDADLTGLAFDAGSEFLLETDDCGATLAVGASCEISIRFAPADTGPVAATLQVTSDQGAAAGIELAGLGIPHPPLIDVDPDSFGIELAEGDSASESLTISNLGDEALNWSIETADPAGGQSALLTLPAGVPVTAALASGTGTDRGFDGTGSLLSIGDAQMSQTADTNIVPSNSVACPAGPNHLLRRFYFDEHPEVGITAEIGSVDIAIQQGVASQLLTVNLYAIPSNTPVDTIPLESLELIGGGSVAISPADDLSIVNVPVGATVLNTQAFDLVVEATANVFYIGATDAGQTHPGFLVAPACGITTPTPIDSLGANFEDTHIIMVVNVERDACHDPASVAWLNVDPAAGSTAPGGSGPVGVQIDSDGLVPGDYEALLCIDSNDPANPRVKVPVALNVLELAPGIAVTPGMHDFGPVPVGDSSAPATITIESTGTIGLQVASISEPGTGFERTGGTCAAAPFALSPGASCTLDYTFEPPAEGPFTTIVTVTSDAVPAVIGIALTGEGEGELPDAVFHSRFEEVTP